MPAPGAYACAKSPGFFAPPGQAGRIDWIPRVGRISLRAQSWTPSSVSMKDSSSASSSASFVTGLPAP